MKNRIIRVFKLLSVLLISLVIFSSVYAQEISLKDVKIVDKNIEIEDPVISGNEITNEINFNEVGNFVTFEITIQNNDSYDYTINNIEDNNKNKNISFSYIYSKTDIKKNSEYKFKVTVLYKNRLENVEEINLKDTKITINLIREDGKESNIVVNPTTGDSILKYILLLIIVLVGVVLKQKKKVFYKVLFIIPILLLPLVIFANESYKQEVIFKDIKVKGVMLPYEVTIKVPGEEPIVRTITYGDEIGELPEVSVDGYDFNGWKDSKGNPVDEHTKVTGEMEISPKLSPIIYTITYDLQGGTATGNKETYTVETDTFTLVNPTKRGYSFSGWTGSNGETLQTEVTVYKGTTGNLSYKAHYRQTENVEYKVIHRKQKLTLDGYDVEEEQTGHGSAGTTVRPETRQYEGFTSPEEQDLLITEDGLASLTYDYNRIIYSYVVDSNTNSTIPSGDYPYGTEATITANNVPGYTFEKWSDGETTNPRNIIISEGTTNITPVYKANEDTAYTVIHYQMDVDGVHYTEYERENKTGTTGEEVTPLPKTYEGFTSPSPKTEVIKGDGSTIIEYQYRRNDITIIINIPGEEPIEKTVKYDDVIGELPTPSKDGYTFDGYEDGDGNPVDENTKVHGEMTITPVFSAIEYTISYDLNGGLNHSENPDKYTIESNNIILKDASRNGYTFIGWTGSNGTTPQKNVVIEKGTTGNKNYKANFSKSADTLDITLDVVSYPYDGNSKTPEVTIKDGDVVLVEGRDYTVEYIDNVNAGEATVKVTMTGSVNPDTGASYEGEKEVHFTILAVPPLVELINTSKEYTGEPIVFTEEDVRITPASGGEISFKYCTDETCEHEVSSIEEAGTYYVIAHVSANGNYSESDSEPTEITIERKGIDVPEVTSTFTYTGNDQELLSDTEYYTVSNNIAKNAGTYDVIVTPTNNYKWSDGTVTPKVVTVTINPYDINNGSVVPVEEYTYDGEEKKPTPSVIVPIPSSVDTTTLTSSDVDYTYENNINAGEASVIITGKGNYTGTITKTFTIDKADGFIELSRTSDNIIYGTDSISVDVLNSTGEIEATTTTSGVSISVNENTITITGLSNIDSGETVNIKVKAKSGANYKEAEETYSITVSDAAITGGSVTITGINGVGETLTASVEDTTPKATYTYEWYRNNEDSMSGGTKIDGETSNTYTLTNDDIGKYIYVVVTASKQNYTPITFKDKVDAENNKTDKTKIEVEIPTSTNTCKNLTYNGDTQILTNESGEGYAYINNSGVNAGEYTVEARLEENYMWSDYTFNNKPVICVINKKNVTIKADNQTKVYDGTPLNADTTCTDKNSDLISGHLPVCTSTGTITNVGNEIKVLNTVIIKQNETDLTNNYNITKENGDLSVTTRDITCTSSSNTKVYDGTPLTDNTGTCTNLVPTQTVTFNNTGTATNVSDTAEGNNTLESVTITDQDSTNVTTNYNIAKHNGTLTITRANSTCEITNNPVLYYPGDNTGSITYACTGDGELSVTSNSNVITVSNVTSTSSALTSTNTGTSTITVSKAEGPNYNSTSAVKEITVNASIYHVIFDKNDEEATGVMEPQDITYGVATALNENQYSKSGYVFVGWNTEPDGTGTPYTDKQEVTSLAESGNVTLYAEWIEAQAMFDTGTMVNRKMKRLAGNSSAIYDTPDTNITSIQKSSVKPDLSQMTNDNIVSISSSTYNTPIYMWFDNGTIYWWSEDNNPSLNSNSSNMIYKFKNLISVNVSDFDSSNVTNMREMFCLNDNVTNIVLGDNFDTSNVTNMVKMFSVNKNLLTLDLGNKFDTNKVTSMVDMFSGCSALTSLQLGNNFDTSKVTNMSGMFSTCRNLITLDLGTKFNTSNVTDMSTMFFAANNLTTLNLGNNFDTSNVTDMGWMFHSCNSLTTLNLGNNFDTSNVTDMDMMFYDCNSLTTLNLGNNFDTSNVKKMSSIFRGCNSITALNLGDKFDTSKVINMKSMFYNCSSLTTLDLGDKFDTSNVTNMESMFDQCSSLTTLNLGDKFDTSNVTTMEKMFYDCENLINLDLGNKFYTSKVITMMDMFNHCESIETIDLGSNFATSDLPDTRRMFEWCKNLTTIYAPNTFDTSNVTSSSDMFTGDTKLVGGLGTVFNSSKIDKEYAHIDGGTSNPGYFTDRNALNIVFDANGGIGTMSNQVATYNTEITLTTNTYTKSGYLFAGWNTTQDGTGTSYLDEATVTVKGNMRLYAQWIEAKAMFDTGSVVNSKMKKLAGNTSATYNSQDTNITSIQKSTTKPDISSFTSDNIVSITNATYNTPIYMWYDNGTIYWWSEDNTPNLNQNSSFMFRFCEALTSISFSSWNTSAVTNMQEMFYSCYSLSNFDFTNIDTSNVTNMNGMFSMIYYLNVDNSVTTLDLSNFNTSNVVDMGNMFSNCNKLTNLNLSSFNTSNVTYMHNIFYRCSSLTSLDLGDKFDTSNVTNMSNMFGDCSSLTLLDLGSKFDTSNVTKMEGMFSGCSSLTTLDLGDKFDTSKVTNMSNMFFYCSSLTSLDLSSFDTSNVTTMYVMFYNDSNLTTIYATNAFVTTSITESTNMFYGDRKIVGGVGTTYDSSHIDATYAHIDGGTSNPGYFTDKSTISIKFDANGGTGTMNDQIVQYNVATPLNTNTYTRSGYIFYGWNTLPDGTGTSFSDGAIIQVKSLTMLYAQWIEDRPESATFDTGQNVVTKMKKLADGEGTYISRNQTIRSIKYTTTKPDISLMNSDNILSSANSESEIYSWYENQTIYIYSNAKNIYLNEDSSYMFCNLTVLTNLDLSSFNTSRVTNMLLMFNSLTSITSLDLSSFDTSNVTNMQQMFSNCTSLTSLNLSSFNTSNVTNMLSMFSTLTSITSLDLSSFNTRKVLYLNSMFRGCNLLRTIYTSNNFVTTSVTNGGTVFYGCTSLKGGAGTSYNSSYIDKTYARIDGGTSNPGYFTYKAAPTGGNISRFINAFKPKNLLTNKFILLGEVLAIITIGSITFVIMYKQRKKIK